MSDNKQEYFYGLGRRKSAKARVRVYFGKGESVVNEKTILEYFTKNTIMVETAFEPLKLTGNFEKAFITVKIDGGGLSGQADAIRLGVARALLAYDENLKTVLKKAGFLTRDPREKERKKPGLKRARKAPQFSKR